MQGGGGGDERVDEGQQLPELIPHPCKDSHTHVIYSKNTTTISNALKDIRFICQNTHQGYHRA
jgi:hypothetical protein